MQWEYAIVSVNARTANELIALLTKESQAGWELATITELGGEKCAVFKRAVEKMGH